MLVGGVCISTVGVGVSGVGWVAVSGGSIY